MFRQTLLRTFLPIYVLLNQGICFPASAYANLLNIETSSDSINKDVSYLHQNVLLDDVKIFEYRDVDVEKFHMGKRHVKRENRNEAQHIAEVRDSQIEVRQSYAVHTADDEVRSALTKNPEISGVPRPFSIIPFKAIVTLTPENDREPRWTSSEEPGDRSDEVTRCTEMKNLLREARGASESSANSKDSQKYRRVSVRDVLEMLRLMTKKKRADGSKGTNIETTSSESEMTADGCMASLIEEFKSGSPQRGTNETSQRQEFDYDEAPGGNLGSIVDLLPIVTPILQDLSDPNTNTDLAAVLNAGLPIIQGLFGVEDFSGLADTVLPILTRLLGGRDGQGSDFFAFITPLVGPLLKATGPFLATIGGPLLGSFLNIIRSPDTVGSIVTALVEGLIQTNGKPNSQIIDAIAGVAASFLKDLRPGSPGGLDIGSIVEAITAGTITGISTASEGSKGHGGYLKPYGPRKPYGTAQGFVQTREVNAPQSRPGLNDGGQQKNSFPQRNTRKPVPAPASNARPHGLRQRTTRRPFFKFPSKIRQEVAPSSQNFVRHSGSEDPVESETTNTHGTDSHYPIYGNNAVPAYSVNPLSNVMWTIKEFLGISDHSSVTNEAVSADTDNTGSGDSSYLPYGNKGTSACGLNPIGVVVSSIQDVVDSGIQLLSSLINAVFGVSGASSVDKAHGYGPPYGPPPQKGNQLSFARKIDN